MTRQRVRLLLLGAAVVLLALIGLAAFRVVQAARAGSRGQHALQEAAAMLTNGASLADIDAATLTKVQTLIATAQQDFRAMHDDLGGAGPMYDVARVIPFARVQVRGVDAINNVGTELCTAASQFVDTAQQFVHPSGPARSLAHGNVLGELRTLQASAVKATQQLSVAYNDLASINGDRLIGPIGSARNTLVQKLPALVDRATSARDGLAAFLAFAGADGPKRYLVLSQNPDEVRPTGGYLGSYGLLTASAGHVHVAEYGDTNEWIAAHPHAVINESAAPAVFKVANSVQNLANANPTPDWAASAQTAIRLWRKGGGVPVNGVLSFTPEFLARLLGVTGPIHVPAYGDTVTAQNVVERTDYWTHHAPSQPVAGGRKEFLSVLAPLVLGRVSSAPSTQWPKLAASLSQGFAAQEAMLWSSDPQMQRFINEHNWDHQLPQANGDFFADSEFSFAAKNGSSIRRSFDHTVVLHADGSAVSTTEITVRDTNPTLIPSINNGAAGWFTPYGPMGAMLASTSDSPASNALPDVDGHPTAGWQLRAPPGGVAHLRVAWTVPQMLTSLGNNRYEYTLTWFPTPSHEGDVVHLHVTPPPGWQWIGAAPPSTLRSDMITSGHWLLENTGAS